MLLFDKWKKNMKKSQTYIVNANLFYSFCFQQFFYSRISFQFSCFIYFFHHLFFFIYSLFFLKKNLLIVTPFIWCCFSASQNAVKYNWGEKRKTAVYSFISFRAWFKKKKKNSSSVQSINDGVFLSWESLLQNTTVEMMVAQVRWTQFPGVLNAYVPCRYFSLDFFFRSSSTEPFSASVRFLVLNWNTSQERETRSDELNWIETWRCSAGVFKPV